jgi:protein required for attachment to host cells
LVQLPRGATVAVADGHILHLFRNSGDEANPTLDSIPAAKDGDEGSGPRGHHPTGSDNPDDKHGAEEGFAAGIADLLNRQVLNGEIAELVIIAAPRTLGEMRKHYHKALSARLMAEIAKDLTGHGPQDIEKAIAAA